MSCSICDVAKQMLLDSSGKLSIETLDEQWNNFIKETRDKSIQETLTFDVKENGYSLDIDKFFKEGKYKKLPKIKVIGTNPILYVPRLLDIVSQRYNYETAINQAIWLDITNNQKTEDQLSPADIRYNDGDIEVLFPMFPKNADKILDLELIYQCLHFD